MSVQHAPGRLLVRLERPPVSAVLRPRALLTGAGLVVVALGALAAGLSVGDYRVPLPQVAAALAGSGTDAARLVVLELRLPRAVTAAAVGVALGLAGALTQGVTRNPLASPDLLGITAGAGAGAVAALVLGGAGGTGVAAAALAGGLGAGLAVHVLAGRRRGGGGGHRLVLVGVGVSALLASVTSGLLVLASTTDAQAAFVWLTGSLSGRTWAHVVPVAAALAVLVPVLVALTRAFALLQLDDDVARGLGSRVRRVRAALLLAAVGLAAMATAAAGPVAFVALVAPQVARRLAGAAAVPLWTSGLAGAALVALADLVGRRAAAPVELPVGVVTAVVGAPVLLWLLSRPGRAGAQR